MGRAFIHRAKADGSTGFHLTDAENKIAVTLASDGDEEAHT
jgi:hypothetical protein